MKIGVFTDLHYCENSSIVRGIGDKYSQRIENCIKSVNWAEKTFIDNGCDVIFCLGDFFDRNNLTAEEITALNELQLYNVPHYMLVGNHEIVNHDCLTSSMHIFNSYPFVTIMDKPHSFIINEGAKTEICFIPYQLESDRKSIVDMFGHKEIDRIIFSHNDIKGLNYGGFISQNGLDLSEITNESNLFINGHLHNGMYLNQEKTILNLGNLTGQNFGENAYDYNHCICIVDTCDLSVSLIENPFAFNFYKIDINNKKDLSKLLDLKSNAVVSISTSDNMKEEVEKTISEQNITKRRIVIDSSKSISQHQIENDISLKVDHIQMFKNFILENLGDIECVNHELQEVCK